MARQGKTQYNFYLDTIADRDIIQGLANVSNKTDTIKEALRYHFIVKKLYPDAEIEVKEDAG